MASPTRQSNKAPQVGDVRSRVDGTTTYWTQDQLNRASQGMGTDAPDMGTITSDALTSQPDPNFPDPSKMPTPKDTYGLDGYMEQLAEDPLWQRLEGDASTAKDNRQSSANDYFNSLLNQRSVESLTLDAEKQAGVAELKNQLNFYNDQLRRERMGMTRAIERAEKNAMGGLASGVQANVDNIRRESLRTQADIAINIMTSQEQYTDAKNIADRYAKALYEEEQNKIDVRKMLYEENKDLFNKAEERQFNLELQSRQDFVTQQRENTKAIFDVGIEATKEGAPRELVQQIYAAKTREEAAALAAPYLGRLDRMQKQASIRASNLSAQKSALEIEALRGTETGNSNIAVQALDSFSGALNQNNREQFTRAVTNGVKRANPEQVEIALKNAAQAAGGAALREDVIKRDQAINALRDVKNALSDYEQAGGSTNLLTGGYEDLQNKLGQTSDPALASIETRINLALNAYTNAVSGASFTPQESARYEALFPSTSNTSVLNTTKVDTLIDSFEANNQSFYGNFLGGYTPSQLAEEAVYQELRAKATPEQLKEAGITQ